MLSSFLKFMNRERALSFSAALCLLTVFAAALPGLFQEDDPFKNAGLWEGEQPTEFISTDIEPELGQDLDSEEIEPLDNDLAVSTSSPFKNASDVELEDYEPYVDPNEVIENLDDPTELNTFSGARGE